MDLKTEAIAGITTFFTMSYIVVVNPPILATPGTGMAFSGVLTATVLICFLMTLMMGLYAKVPLAVAPGMGINAFFTFTIIFTQKVWWQVALGIVFWAGVLFLEINFRKIEEGLPAFLTIILIPLTFSITQGILWGFISHVGLYLVVGRRKEIHPVMYALALVAIGLLLLEHSDVSKGLYE